VAWCEAGTKPGRQETVTRGWACWETAWGWAVHLEGNQGCGQQQGPPWAQMSCVTEAPMVKVIYCSFC